MGQGHAALELKGALIPFVEKNLGAVPKPSRAAELMRAIAGYNGEPATRAALELSALLFQRPGNLRMMEWAELDLDGGIWEIPAAKMKRSTHGKVNGRAHFVPLADRSVEILRELKNLTGHGQ